MTKSEDRIRGQNQRAQSEGGGLAVRRLLPLLPTTLKILFDNSIYKRGFEKISVTSSWQRFL